MTSKRFYVIKKFGMDKKDIYEHLAKIYLDASSKKKRKNKSHSKLLQNLFIVSLAFTFSPSAILLATLHSGKEKVPNSDIALVLCPEALKINFDFNPAKKEIYSLNLNQLNLNRYRSLAFSVRKANFNDTISLRVEFSNVFKERSELYVKNIPYRWNDCTLDFSAFKGISDWSEMNSLSFIVEQWNTRENHGIVYIDNIRIIK